MQERLDKLIRIIYKNWKSSRRLVKQSHPDEEDFACFFEGRLSEEEQARIKEHIITCDRCAEVFSIQAKLKDGKIKQMPQDLFGWTKNLTSVDDKLPIFEVVLRLKEKLLEILATNGDVLVGNEFVPAPILRSRRIKEFKDEVTILKEFKDIRVEIRIDSKGSNVFSVVIMVREKQTQKILKDLRVTLIKDDLELESYLTDSGSVTFEHVKLGKYKLEIRSLEEKVASVLLDVRI